MLDSHALCCALGSFSLALTRRLSQDVCGTANASSATVQNVCVNHRRANVLMAQKFLHRADVVALGQQVCVETHRGTSIKGWLFAALVSNDGRTLGTLYEKNPSRLGRGSSSLIDTRL